VEALHLPDAQLPGIWLVEQVVPPGRFLERLAAYGLVPVFEEVATATRRTEVAHA